MNPDEWDVTEEDREAAQHWAELDDDS